MEKYFFPFVAMCFLSFIAPHNTSSSQVQVKGSVKSISDTTFNGVEKFGVFQVQGIKSVVVAFYDTLGMKLEENIYNSDGSLKEKVIFKYNIEGNLIERNQFDQKGSLVTKRILEYDNKGNNIETNGYIDSGKLFTKIILSYDSKGNNIKRISYSFDGSLSSTTIYEYDSNSCNTKVEYKSIKYKITYNHTFKYDDKGNQIEVKRYNLDGSSKGPGATIKYEYDSFGNWIKKSTFEGFNQTELIEREISYY